MWVAPVDEVSLYMSTVQKHGALCIDSICMENMHTSYLYKYKIPVNVAGILKIVHCPNTFD